MASSALENRQPSPSVRSTRNVRSVARRTSVSTVEPDPEQPEWELVLRIVASERFQRSPLLTNFLLYIARQALTGHSELINENQIGIHVFGREEHFNRSDDNIVRNYARLLRTRLDQFFSDEGAQESLRLQIPRGGYLPLFSQVAEPQSDPPLADAPLQSAPAEAHEQTVSPLAPLPPRTWRPNLFIALGLALASALGFALAMAQPWTWYKLLSPTAHRNHLFWNSLFRSDQEAMVVLSDNGLVNLRRFVGQPVSLHDYVSGSYMSKDSIDAGLRQLLHDPNSSQFPVLSQKIQKVGAGGYSNAEDIRLFERISTLPEVTPSHLHILNARQVQVDDLKHSNAVLIGSLDANPWASLFQEQLNFQFSLGGPFGNSGVILNRNPKPGEAKTYASITGDPDLRTYGVIAYVPNISGSGHVLLIEGINLAGTQAAGEFLLDSSRMAPVLKRASSSNGEIRPFEILLGTVSVGSSSSELRILGERIQQK